MTDWEAELERVAFHIAAAEQRIAHQRKKIDRLSSGECAASEAKKQLEMMLTILEMMKKYQFAIEWRLSESLLH